MESAFYGKIEHLENTENRRWGHVSAQVEAQGRQGLPGPGRGLPPGRQVEDEDRRVPGLPRQAPGALRRSHRALPGGLRRAQRRQGGRGPGRRHRDPPAAEDRQARRRPQEHRLGGAAGRLQRPGRRDRHPQRHQGLQGRLRRERRHEATYRGTHPGPRLQETRLGEQGEVLLQDRVLARRHLPRARSHLRLQGQDRVGGQPHRRQDGDPRHRLRVLRRHQLLLRGRRAGRPSPEGRLQGAPQGSYRADGPAAGLGRHPDRRTVRRPPPCGRAYRTE